MKQCKKQTVVAVIMKDNKLISTGTNEIHADVENCPRIGMKAGDGYELCKTVCKQKYHAEEEACIRAGKNAKGSTLHLIGHTYCYDNCLKVMKIHGVKQVKIGMNTILL